MSNRDQTSPRDFNTHETSDVKHQTGEMANRQAPAECDDRRHPFDAVQFVRQAFALATCDPAFIENGQVTAAGVCRVVLEVAVDQFGAEGKQVLLDWNLARSEDVGLIVYRLIDAGLAGKSSTDRIDDFAGLFDLEKPPDEWRLKWS